jgi:hypothetical protein
MASRGLSKINAGRLPAPRSNVHTQMQPLSSADGLSGSARPGRRILALSAGLFGLGAAAACSAKDPDSTPNRGTDGVPATAGAVGSGGRTGGAPSGGMSAKGGSGGQPAAFAGAPATGGTGGPVSGGKAGAGGSSAGSDAGGAATGGASVVGPLPASCAEAAAAYHVESKSLDASWVPFTRTSGFNEALFADVPVAVGADNQVYVGFTRAEGSSYSAWIAPVAGGKPIVFAGAMNGGIAVTSDGFGVLLFDPIANVDERMWAAVGRVRADGSEVFQTDLFRSQNLEDEGTKGAPSTSRLGYVSGTDQLVAYFGHTQRYDDDVRHQGGYLATMDASGEQTLLSGWFGSHNLDQRLLARSDDAFVLGIGDAYPEGIFFSQVEDRPETEVLQPLASAGNGATNGQLGGIVEVGGELVIPFVTNRSIPEDLDAGTWPDIDETIAAQIRDAAAAGTDLGLLKLSDDGSVPDSLEPLWLEPMPASGARIERLKSARYGDAELVLLAWAEISGSGRQGMTRYFTLVVDADGNVCQPKTELPPEFAFSAGDDIVRRPDGVLVWANVASDVIRVITLIPG